ncbi:MAG: hypothetical protein QOG97_3712 [Acidimicrobiaceae bacterium]|nr:hypothetical protein [Acidimicrobiaceae bacterium]
MTSLSPGDFALNLIRGTVTTARVAAVMKRIAGERIEVGPLRFGPGGAVTATGVGLIGPIQVTPAVGAGFGSGPTGTNRSTGPTGSTGTTGTIAFDANIPGDLTIDLTAGSNGRRHRYDGTVVVPLHITVVFEAPAWVVLDVATLRANEVTVRLRTTGMATFVLQTVGDANGEVAAQVAAVVNERVLAVADLRRIDLAGLLDRAWDAEVEARLRAVDPEGAAGGVPSAQMSL